MTASVQGGRRSKRADAAGPLLEIKGLKTHFFTQDGIVKAVDGVSFAIGDGKTLGVVGESGCGKSVTAMSVLGLVSRPGKIVAGQILLDGRDLVKLPENDLREVRGNDIAIIFQEPMTSLNPVFTVGDQIAEVAGMHLHIDRKAAMARAVEMLSFVGIPDAKRRAKEYPHQLSGGMRQRVMIAMALSTNPALLIADEPTTALDVTIQAQILELMKEMRTRNGMAIMLITHDLGVVAEMADDVAVMYAGKIVEQSTAETVFERPHHPYTRGLLASIPRLGERRTRLEVIQGTVPNPLNLPGRLSVQTSLPLRDAHLRHAAAAPDGRAWPSVAVLADAGRSAPRRRDGRAPGRRRGRCRQPVGRGSIVRHPGQPSMTEPFAASGIPETGTMPPVAPPIGVLSDHRTATKAGETDTLVEVQDLVKHFEIRGGLLGFRKIGAVRAVDGVCFDVRRGETLGLVGESGCGKTTLGKVILRLIPPTSGRVAVNGRSIFELSDKEMVPVRRDMQIVFQDPYASLNPRMTVGEIVGEGPFVHGLTNKREREDVVRELLGRVGLNQTHIHRYPHEFSGGQRQRIGIARALALNPEFIVCDEPVSALDVSIQSQVLNLLDDLQQELGLTYLFIAHNLAVVEHISDRVGVMYLGKLVELAKVDDLYATPAHPYTVALLSAVPETDPRKRKKRIVLKGDVPSPAAPPSGCRFHTRCWLRTQLGNPERCKTEEPALREIRPGQESACHFAEEITPETIEVVGRTTDHVATAGLAAG